MAGREMSILIYFNHLIIYPVWSVCSYVIKAVSFWDTQPMNWSQPAPATVGIRLQTVLLISHTDWTHHHSACNNVTDKHSSSTVSLYQSRLTFEVLDLAFGSDLLLKSELLSACMLHLAVCLLHVGKLNQCKALDLKFALLKFWSFCIIDRNHSELEHAWTEIKQKHDMTKIPPKI